MQQLYRASSCTALITRYRVFFHFDADALPRAFLSAGSKNRKTFGRARGHLARERSRVHELKDSTFRLRRIIAHSKRKLHLPSLFPPTMSVARCLTAPSKRVLSSSFLRPVPSFWTNGSRPNAYKGDVR